jgi:hypothetical protein
VEPHPGHGQRTVQRRSRTPSEERPAAYWIFFAAVVGFVVLAVLLLAYV